MGKNVAQMLRKSIQARFESSHNNSLPNLSEKSLKYYRNTINDITTTLVKGLVTDLREQKPSNKSSRLSKHLK